MSDYEFIRKFKSITITKVVNDLGLKKDYGNIMNGTASKVKIAKVRKEIEKRLAEIGKCKEY